MHTELGISVSGLIKTKQTPDLGELPFRLLDMLLFGHGWKPTCMTNLYAGHAILVLGSVSRSEASGKYILLEFNPFQKGFPL